MEGAGRGGRRHGRLRSYCVVVLPLTVGLDRGGGWLYHRSMTKHRDRLPRFAAAALLAFLSVSMAVPGCATTQPVVTKVSNVVDCSAQTVVSQLPSIISEVVTDLLSTDYVKLLTDIGRRVGTDAMVCAVKVAGDRASVRMATTPGDQPNAEAIRDHADTYLQLRDVKFVEPPARENAAAYCQPACNACQQCFQLSGGQPVHLLPPACIPKLPRPDGCP